MYKHRVNNSTFYNTSQQRNPINYEFKAVQHASWDANLATLNSIAWIAITIAIPCATLYLLNTHKNIETHKEMHYLAHMQLNDVLT